MPLTWDISEVKNWQEKKSDAMKNAVLETLVWNSLLYDIPKITEKNVTEVYCRLKMLNTFSQALTLYSKDGKEIEIKFNDIREWIGLRTNTTQATPKQWDRNFAAMLRNRVQREVDMEKRNDGKQQ